MTKLEASMCAVRELVAVARKWRERQTAWLRANGFTWTEARALDNAGRAALQARWAAYLAEHAW